MLICHGIFSSLIIIVNLPAFPAFNPAAESQPLKSQCAGSCNYRSNTKNNFSIVT